MITILQFVFLACVIAAVVALTDWRWGLLLVGVVGFVSSFQAERKKAG